MTHIAPILQMRTILPVQSTRFIFSVLSSCQRTIEIKENSNVVCHVFQDNHDTVWARMGTHRQKIYKAKILKNYNPLHTNMWSHH